MATMMTQTTPIEWFQLCMGLFGGLALFLFGLDLMAKGLQAAVGEGMKTILARLTRNRVFGALTGAVVTAVLMVGFVTAGLMTLSQSIGVIMGANVGSTVTAQIVAFNVTQYALGMIAVGFAMLFVGKRWTPCAPSRRFSTRWHGWRTRCWASSWRRFLPV